jgi:molybdopterin converting factor small subunit
MSEAQSRIRNSQSETARVTIEAIAWATQFVGGDGTRRRVFDEAVDSDTTVRSVLSRLSDRYPTLRNVLWNRASGDLSEHIEILVNDVVLGLSHTLDSPVRDGDRITLLGQYAGG